MSRADDLYGLPLDEFIGARDALAKELRSDGDRDAAAAVKKLRKPNLAAWALNQLARRHGEQIDSLLESGQRLRAAQRKVMSGGKADDLREATEERRRLVGALVKEAEEILTASGHAASAATTSGVHDSLMAVATDDEGADRLRRGVLERELQPGEIPEIAGFTVIEGGKARPTAAPRTEPAADVPEPAPEAPSVDAPVPAPEAPSADDATEARTIRDRIAARVDDLDAEASVAERALAEAEKAADDARTQASEAEAEAERAAAAADEARRTAEEAKRRAEDVQREAEHRTNDAEDARAKAAKAREDAEAARRSLEQAEALLESLTSSEQ